MRGGQFGVNVFGFLSAEFGLASAARQTLRMLEGRGCPVAANDVWLSDGRSGRNHEFDRVAPSRDPMPHPLNLFQVNPPELRDLIIRPAGGPRIERRVNAIVPFWELPVLPPLWKETLSLMDLVLAPSRFIEETVSSALPGLPVLHFPQVCFVPDGTLPDRPRWGFTEGHTVFLSAFDMQSDVHRKNPWGAIEAFTRAFAPSDKATLAIKLSNARRPEYAKALLRLRECASAHTGIRILEGEFPFADVASLYASADVFVSLHRAEGLGLIPMECMSLGKAVIATAWSGNMDFCTGDNSCLVPYRLVQVAESTHPHYLPDFVGSTASWADPDLDAAAEWMRRLHDDPSLRSRIGLKAAEDMAEARLRHARGAVVDALREFTESRPRSRFFRDGKGRGIAALRKEERQAWIVRLPARIRRKAGTLLRGGGGDADRWGRR